MGTKHCKKHAACVYRVLDFHSCHKERLFRDSASFLRLDSRLLSQKEVVGHAKLRTVSTLHLPLASWSPTSTLRAQPTSRLQAGKIFVLQDALLLPHAACSHAWSFRSFDVAQSVRRNTSNCHKVTRQPKSARLPPCCLQIHPALLSAPLRCLLISLLYPLLITSRLLSTDKVQMLPPSSAMQPCCPRPTPLPSAVTQAATALLAAGCLSGRLGPDFCYLLYTLVIAYRVKSLQ